MGPHRSWPSVAPLGVQKIKIPATRLGTQQAESPGTRETVWWARHGTNSPPSRSSPTEDSLAF